MITLRRAGERRRVRPGSRPAPLSDSWLAFFPGAGGGPFADGFGAIATLDEERLSPGARTLSRPDVGAETVAYVLEGALAYADLTGRHAILEAGDFLSVTSGLGFRHAERNVSCTDGAHVILIGLRATVPASGPSVEQQRFSAAERRGVLRVVASADGRRGSLTVHQDVVVHSALLFLGQHIVHPLRPGRSAWCQVVFGRVTLGGIPLETGDGAAVTGERAVSVTATTDAEVLLFDMPESSKGPESNGDGAKQAPSSERTRKSRASN